MFLKLNTSRCFLKQHYFNKYFWVLLYVRCVSTTFDLPSVAVFKFIICREYLTSLVYMVFIDFKQAYETVKREKVYKAMRGLGIPNKYVKLVKMTLKETDYKVQVNGNISKGLKQGTHCQQPSSI